MEKLQYLCWPRAGQTPEDHGRITREDVAPALLALGPRGLSIQVDDADAQVPVPMPPPADEVQPFALVSVWLDRYDDRAPYEAVLRDASHRIAGYLVTESLYTDYGGNRFSGPRDWPDGTRSPGVVMVTLLRRPARMAAGRLDHALAHRAVAGLGGHAAAHALRPQRRGPPDHDRRTTDRRHRRGSVALTRAPDRPDALLLRGR
jgi:hypothetical protein